MRPISRRECLLAMAAVAHSVAFGNGMTKPKNSKTARPQFSKGALAAIVAPAGAGPKSEVDEAVQKLESMGFRTRVGSKVTKSFSFFAGKDEDRAKDFNKAILDPEVELIFCTRGGYGSARILELINWDAYRKRPKAIIGYSDITALHLAAYAKAKAVTYHGPAAISSWNDFQISSATRAWSDPEPYDLLSSGGIPTGATWLVPPTKSVAGPLLGGNLCVLCSILGGKFTPRFDRSILFLEDIAEAPYRIDRLLNQLKLAGILDRLNGVVFGKFTACINDEEDKGKVPELPQVIEEWFGSAPYPVMIGADIGHVKNNLMVPHGAKARIKLGPIPNLWV